MTMDGQCILIVEDHQPLREALRTILERERYRVLTAKNGAHALHIMERQPPDLIVADIMMPGMGGYDLYQAVRAHPKWVAIPFIFLTVRGEYEDVLRGKALGVDDYLIKPLNPEELLVAIRARLGRSCAIQEAAEVEVEGLKQRIANVLIHELCTPLTHIRCYADLALESISSRQDDELEQLWKGIKHGVDRLTDLVGDVTLLTQLETIWTEESFRAQTTIRSDLNNILEKSVSQYEEQAAERGLTLGMHVEPNLPAIRLHEPFFVDALGRLLDNAIKFSLSEEGRVIVRGWQVEDWVEVAVIDDGVGIAPREIPHLFERFEQIGRQEMEQQGLGLGLPIVRRLIDLQGGEVTVESAPGKGSTFTIRLPVAEI